MQDGPPGGAGVVGAEDSEKALLLREELARCVRIRRKEHVGLAASQASAMRLTSYPSASSCVLSGSRLSRSPLYRAAPVVSSAPDRDATARDREVQAIRDVVRNQVGDPGVLRHDGGDIPGLGRGRRRSPLALEQSARGRDEDASSGRRRRPRSLSLAACGRRSRDASGVTAQVSPPSSLTRSPSPRNAIGVPLPSPVPT